MSVVKPFNRRSLQPDSVISISSSVGTIVEVNEQGVAKVDFPENTGAPITARSTLNDLDKIELTGKSVDVLLVFEQSDIQKPIITGIINQVLFAPQTVNKTKIDKSQGDGIVVSNKGQATNATIDGKKISFNAKEEILLRCGKSSILLRKDGKIVIKGANLISRSSSTNKIKGSSVSIN